MLLPSLTHCPAHHKQLPHCENARQNMGIFSILKAVAPKELRPILQRGLIHNHGCALRFYTLHNPLDAALPKVVRIRFHNQSIYAYDTFFLFPLVPQNAALIIP